VLVLADNDVGGAVTALRRVLESDQFAAVTQALELESVVFEDLGLRRDASDRQVWQACQKASAVLITGNRASGQNSLEQTILEAAHADSLPVVTLGDPQRIVRDRPYAEDCALSLLDLLDRIESLRGTGRLFVP
jgi:hypothetical protein